MGILGIDLATRRRNRVNGTIKSVHEHGFAIAVTQSFGNCSQYIQKRQLQWLTKQPDIMGKHPGQLTTQLDQPMRELINRSDTLFLSTRFSNSHTHASHGVDVSHRGGKPGFVKIENSRTLTIPDFSGNNFFNALGNILLDHRVGVLFIDFETGNLSAITGQAQVIWDGNELKQFEGAERLVQITIGDIIYRSNALPFRWIFQEYSPPLEFTGAWNHVL